jgi:hypothetical protein
MAAAQDMLPDETRSQLGALVTELNLITSLLHTCVHREIEHRMDDAADRRTRFTLVNGKGA